VVALLALATRPAEAQDAPPPATANAVGMVFDRVRIRPLAGAKVRVDTSNLVAVTDAEGRFSLTGIPAGPHELRIEHPVLDTLGLDLRSARLMFAAGSTSLHEFGTPSAERIIEIVCPEAWRARGPAALVGRVREADTGRPATGAKVSLVWYEVSVADGLRRTPRVREATVGADGIYRICGLPAQLDGKVQVIRGALTSGDVSVGFGEDMLAARSMTIAPPGAVVATAPGSAPGSAPAVLGTARLNGRVVNKAGAPLSGARVQLEGTTRATSTRAGGEFSLDSLPAGTQSVAVRLLGYAPVEAAVDLSSGEPRTVTITMEDFVPVLEAVRVSAQRERALDDVGFTRRKRTGLGFYLDGDDLKNRNAQYFSDILRAAPAVRVATDGRGRQMLQNARDPMGGCVMIYVDGNMWQQMEPGDIDDFVKPHEVGAIEVYSATNTPAEYQSRGGSCSTIVAWTHRKLERRRSR
jgi:hypothetical protein